MKDNMSAKIHFEKKKRGEMTFGYLPAQIKQDIVPDMSGSFKAYSLEEIFQHMMDMDAGFTGLRRSTIDATESVRQLIMYTVLYKKIDGQTVYGVYQRSAGSDPNLQGSFSIGFGGHVEVVDLSCHANCAEDDRILKQFNECPSSYYSTLRSAYRELFEEVKFIGQEEREMEFDDICNAVAKELGMNNIDSTRLEDEAAFEALREKACLKGDKYLLVRDPENSERGVVYTASEVIISAATLYTDLFGKAPITNEVDNDIEFVIVPKGFLSDYLPEKKGHVGNTHFCVVATCEVPDDVDFVVSDSNYTTIGWQTAEQIRENATKFEAWSAILVDHLSDLV
jgi:predicted NUDIX family phosphoesterase